MIMGFLQSFSRSNFIARTKLEARPKKIQIPLRV